MMYISEIFKQEEGATRCKELHILIYYNILKQCVLILILFPSFITSNNLIIFNNIVVAPFFYVIPIYKIILLE